MFYFLGKIASAKTKPREQPSLRGYTIFQSGNIYTLPEWLGTCPGFLLLLPDW